MRAPGPVNSLADLRRVARKLDEELAPGSSLRPEAGVAIVGGGKARVAARARGSEVHVDVSWGQIHGALTTIARPLGVVRHFVPQLKVGEAITDVVLSLTDPDESWKGRIKGAVEGAAIILPVAIGIPIIGLFVGLTVWSMIKKRMK